MQGVLSLLILGTLAVAALWYLILGRRARRYRPLSHYREEIHAARRPLGLEAIDMDLIDRVTRRNQSLERANTTPFGTGSRRAETPITPPQDNQDYARWFHSKFNNEGRLR